jgi:hypothetical protein
MIARNPPQGRVEIVLGALLYLMTAYRRTPCPRIAGAVARHLDCLAAHPDAEPAIRDLCTEMRAEWERALPSRPARETLH